MSDIWQTLADSQPAIIKKVLKLPFAGLNLNNPAKPDKPVKPTEKQKCFTKCLSLNTFKIQIGLEMALGIKNMFVAKHNLNSF